MFRQLHRQTVRALPRSRFVYSHPVHNTLVPRTGPNSTEQQKNQRKAKWTTPYSRMTLADAEKRLGFTVASLVSNAIPVNRMLANAKYGPDTILKTKEKVYDEIVQYLGVMGYPTDADPGFKESSINHLVYATISPILIDFKRVTGRESIRLLSEKEIVSMDGETGGTEEFVVVDHISLGEERYILIVEAKRYSLGQAMKQCLLAMKDLWDNNTGGDVYGFVSTGTQWQMIRYDGISFITTEEFTVLFQTMGTDKKRWMNDYSVVVDCIYVALSKGGIAEKCDN